MQIKIINICNNLKLENILMKLFENMLQSKRSTVCVCVCVWVTPTDTYDIFIVSVSSN